MINIEYMNTDDFSTQVSRLTKVIASQCIVFKSDGNGSHQLAIDWCRENAGEERGGHPIYEAKEGYLDYFEGEWAYTHVADDIYSFWFFRKNIRTQFKLTWC